MAKNTETFNKELDGWLRARGINQIATKNADGEPTTPDQADQFIFDFKSGDTDYGTVVITTHGGRVTVYYNEPSDEGGKDPSWTSFLKKLKDWSLRNGQMGFGLTNIDRLGVEMMKRKQQKREEKLLESYYGNKHTSYSDNTPRIKMIIKHNRALDENDKRYCYVEKIFLENELGERVLAPTKKPSIGRVFARHLAEGGQYNDERWNHIREISEDISKLGGFLRASKNQNLSEGAIQVVTEVEQHYSSLKETIKKLQGARGYTKYFESWQPTVMEDDCETDYAGMFTANRLDPRIEAAIPTLSKLKIRASEISEAEEFESWANSIVETRRPEMDKKIDDLLSILKSNETIAVGPDAISIKGQLEDIFDDDEDRSELFSELEDAAKADPDNDAKALIVAWLQKNRDQEFYDEILNKMEVETPPSEPAAKTAQAQPKQKSAPQKSKPEEKKADAVKSLMPAPLAEEQDDLSLIQRLSGLI